MLVVDNEMRYIVVCGRFYCQFRKGLHIDLHSNLLTEKRQKCTMWHRKSLNLIGKWLNKLVNIIRIADSVVTTARLSV